MNVHRDLIIETGNILGEARTVNGATPLDGVRFLNADITIALNEGADEMNRLTGIYRVNTQIPTVTGTQTYLVRDGNNNVPMGKIIRIETTTGDLLIETTKQEIDNTYSGSQSNWQQEQGPLRCWYPETDDYGRFGLYPKPASAQDLVIWFPGKANPMVDNSDSPWAGSGIITLQQYHYVLPWYAAFKLLKRYGDANDESKATDCKNTFDGYVKQAASDPLGIMAVA